MGNLQGQGDAGGGRRVDGEQSDGVVDKAAAREFIEIVGIFSMFALSVYAFLVWWLAFQNGGRVWIDVNAAGEMWIEYALWTVITPMITLSMYYYLKQENRTRK